MMGGFPKAVHERSVPFVLIPPLRVLIMRREEQSQFATLGYSSAI